ncbi:hypothetical protein MetexDRAFT_5585 [Methylorubrum extorquens DSM 13060]|uniref:Uncharacterized protein n=3 Tax=Methylorubrum extorquens TaxID=408 RepID=C5B5W3_METEA|nr:Hypothetical protein MexAM1_META2p1065 [Methylorubrum extorquens AM1]EHP87792.1 hypothetical protein MetexDRAFT_5585 [Methylorubrum extorquens DSM 13060]MCP1546310.1 non-ribosomal peptide synthetase component F [Methylorubrum extorquens]MCP1590977.1 non-ribosomal peptide synthetase component F [Methylorubrum extorquens]
MLMVPEPLDPEFDDERRERWLHGRCALFAVALHRATGLAIMAWIDDDPEVGVPVLVHAFVLDGGSALDAWGRRDPDDLLSDYAHWNPELVAMTEAEVLAIGEGPDIDPALMAEAEADAALVAARFVPAQASPVP